MDFEVALSGAAVVYTENGDGDADPRFAAIDPADDDSQESSDDGEAERYVKLEQRISVVVDPVIERQKVFAQICSEVSAVMQRNTGMFQSLLSTLQNERVNAGAALGDAWESITTRYRERVLPVVSAATDFADVIQEMLAELQVSHVSYFSAGVDASLDVRRGEGHAADEDQGSLCCDCEWDDRVQGLRLTRIYAGDGWDIDFAGPLAYRADVFRVGDVLLSVDGTRLTERTSLDQSLQHHAHKSVIVEFVPVCYVDAFEAIRATAACNVGRPTSGGIDVDNPFHAVAGLNPGSQLRHLYARSRKAWVCAADMAQDANVRFRDRQRDVVAAIEQHQRVHWPTIIAGGHRISYVQVTDMTRTGFAEFHRAMSACQAGVIVDVRGNLGGSVAEQLLRFLHMPQLGWDVPNGRPTPWPANSCLFPRAAVLVVNETCISDGDALAAGWKQLGLGCVVGTRTFGGLLSITNDCELLDGSELTLPSDDFRPMAGHTVDTDPARRVENAGVEPDHVVEYPPSFQGAPSLDPQLRVAVDEVLRVIGQHLDNTASQ